MFWMNEIPRFRSVTYAQEHYTEKRERYNTPPVIQTMLHLPIITPPSQR